MGTRFAEDIVRYRQFVKEYLDMTDDPEPLGAELYARDRCREIGIDPPTLSTVTRIMKANGWRSKRWAWRHNGHEG